MKKQKTRNYSIDRKLLLFNSQFPEVKISRGTLHKIQRRSLNYTYKRISQYIKKKPANIVLKRIYFIQEFIKALKDDNAKVFVIDEVGFGTKALRHYSYAKCGEKAV